MKIEHNLQIKKEIEKIKKYSIKIVLIIILVIVCSIFGVAKFNLHHIEKQNLKIEEIEINLNDMIRLNEEQKMEIDLLYDELYNLTDTLKEVEKQAKLENTINLDDPEFLIKSACESCGIDYKLAIAISRLETANWSSDIYLDYNNFGGMRYDDEWNYYNTKIEGANAFVLMLKEYYIDEGLNNPKLMCEKYCPDDPYDWSARVYDIMEEVE